MKRSHSTCQSYCQACTLTQQRNAQCTGGQPTFQHTTFDNLNCHSIDTPPKQAADQVKPAWQVSPSGTAKPYIVPAAHGYAFQVKASPKRTLPGVMIRHGLYGVTSWR